MSEPITPAEQAKIEAETKKLEVEMERQRLALEKEQLKADTEAASADRRHIYVFEGEVNKASCSACAERLTMWSRRDPGCGITIILNSPGGSVIDGLALWDTIMALKEKGHQFKVIVRGMAASMGAVLLQAGDERLVGPKSHVMIHEISYGAIGSFGEIEDERAFAKMLQDKILDILAERSTLSKAQIKRRWERKNWWFGAEEAVELGFADKIG